MEKKLYRYRTVYASEWNPNYIELEEYPIKRETPEYYIIEVDWKEKRCKKNATNSFAYDTKQKAIRNYRERTKRYLAILEDSVKNVSNIIQMLEDITDIELEGFSQKTGYHKCKVIFGGKEFYDWGDYAYDNRLLS